MARLSDVSSVFILSPARVRAGIESVWDIGAAADSAARHIGVAADSVMKQRRVPADSVAKQQRIPADSGARIILSRKDSVRTDSARRRP